ncbi:MULTISPECIES: ABC transporter permease [unclassified Pseudodesulfovibrio]|uniref:ABC transporter permease n=1 Tax=unclassified Pseudodesulfovibrio TaxID=2661612 RepID=UPI000FEC03A8|nr:MULTISPECIES: ABC transporter permease [unclassified Pseudodesulfovibrio]MCJ2164385.1 ABC transporter permease [Pseudodesulfovibrio sp. S3-i]RWU04592.1 ABC transporter permease [Pseudodesulfovibrio sp. S3]
MEMFALTIAAVLIAGAPLVLATLGETLTEKAGIINLSLDGSILLAAMAAFAVSTTFDSPWLGAVAGMGVGAGIAGLLGLIGIYLGQSQLAVGFILTLLSRDLAYFLGHNFSRQPGPDLGLWTIPGIGNVPFLGPIFGSQSPVVYMGLAAIFCCWWWMYHTEGGMRLRAVGESPRAAFGRGIRVRLVRLCYCLAGGALVGLAGAAYSLAVKPGWGRPQGCEGAGWIALAIVIFGGWHPVRAALGAFFFAALQVSGIYLQEMFPSIPAPVFQVAPFPMMILTLLAVNMGRMGWVQDIVRRHPFLKSLSKGWSIEAPAALGQDFDSKKGL